MVPKEGLGPSSPLRAGGVESPVLGALTRNEWPFCGWLLRCVWVEGCDARCTSPHDVARQVAGFGGGDGVVSTTARPVPHKATHVAACWRVSARRGRTDAGVATGTGLPRAPVARPCVGIPRVEFSDAIARIL
jgi:hypothetical protein